MVVAPLMLVRDPAMVNDEELLEGAASAWAVITYAADLPTTPEHHEALGLAKLRLVEMIEAVGLSESQVESYLQTRRRPRGDSTRLRSLPD
ncbi:MAG: hypothetical protein WKF41_12975 [Gaiellaceae bacterium]